MNQLPKRVFPRAAIVAAGVGGASELLSASAGLIVPPDSIEDLTAALMTVGGDSQTRAKLQTAAREAFGSSRTRREAVIEAILGSYRRAAS